MKSIPDPSGDVVLGDDFLVERDGEGTLDPGDEFAVEAALQLVESSGGEVTACRWARREPCRRSGEPSRWARTGAVIVTDDALRGADALATARVLAATVGRTPYDVILAGVESTDGYTGTVPITVAEFLGLPATTFARKLDVANGAIRVERQTEAGYDVVESPLPVLVTVTAGATEPRYPTLKGIMGAKQKPVEQLTLADLGLPADDVAPDPTGGPSSPPRRRRGRDHPGDGAVGRVADLLADAKVI